MKTFIIFSAILAICSAFFDRQFINKKLNTNKNGIDAVYPFENREGFNVSTYDTPLDHFSPTDGRILRLNYIANVRSFEQNGPLFFYINLDNFLQSENNYTEAGLIVDLANELNGAVIQATPRYFDDNSLGNLTLKYLTIDHLLADIPHLILKVKKDLKTEKSRVIVFGARRSGTLAALARKKFPHIVDGAWSSSGFFTAFVPDPSYFNAAAWNIDNHGQKNCTNALASAFSEIVRLIKLRNADKLQSILALCRKPVFDDEQDVQFLYYAATFPVAEIMNQRHLIGIQELCGNVTSEGEPASLYSKWFRRFFSDDGAELLCLDTRYKEFMESIRTVEDRRRTFFYYDCTQFGSNFVVTPENGYKNVFSPFLNQTFFDKLCHDVFGDVYNWTLLQNSCDNFNIQHGSQNQVISNAIFSNGELDPSIGHGILEYDLETSLALTTPLVGSAADLDSISDSDSDELQKTKTQIINILTLLSASPDTDDDDSEEGDPKILN